MPITSHHWRIMLGWLAGLRGTSGMGRRGLSGYPTAKGARTNLALRALSNRLVDNLHGWLSAAALRRDGWLGLIGPGHVHKTALDALASPRDLRATHDVWRTFVQPVMLCRHASSGAEPPAPPMCAEHG
jgi:hypothetical protein